MRHSDLATKSHETTIGEMLDLFRPQVRRPTALSDEDDGYCVFRSVFPTGVFVPLHSHANRKTLCIPEGVLQGLGRDRWVTLAAGEGRWR
jgi:hypothetical protein